ncbi:MAG: hypothetical protein GX273_04270 [Bacteroidales bacterium]|jgi:hypothetical protein|nr:hypothetical protein [Bacteroidales bacterium]NLN94572.1 hypothetical protein [Bacteroidales bacterium]
MYKLEFTLKQHTPLIHFQHYQEGATLRATEVKPKLDRFIIEKLTGKSGKEAFEVFKANAEWRKWLVGKGEHPALDYKMRIISKSENRYFLPLAMTPNTRKYNNRENKLKEHIKNSINIDVELLTSTAFFANQDKFSFRFNEVDTIKTKCSNMQFAVLQKSLDLVILSRLEDNFKNQIEKLIKDFFALYNFGMRSSKGFGSFSINDKNNQNKNSFEESLKSTFDVVFKYNNNIINNFKSALQKANELNNLIRSGKNHGGYSKSLLFLYFVNQSTPIRWEKRKIKQNINSNKLKYKKSDNNLIDIDLKYTHKPIYDDSNNNWIDIPNKFEYRYIRSLLGLNEVFEFQTNEIIDTIGGGPKKIKHTYIVEVKSNNVIQRITSPLIWKYNGTNLYLCANDINPDILNSSNNSVTYNFDLKLKKNNKLIDRPFANRDDFLKNIAAPNSFNIGKFLEYCFIKCNKTEKISGFTQIKNNLI